MPYLLVPQEVTPHEGTVDIDIVLDLNQPGADETLTLHDVLERRLFQQDTKKPFRYTKTVNVDGESHTVLIELLAGGTPTSNGLRKISTEDVYVSIIQGIEVALEHPIQVTLPGENDTPVWVASIPTFFAMKAVALDRRELRKKSKDAYDIIYCLRNFPGGVGEIAAKYHEVLPSELVTDGLDLLRSQFESTESIGPTAFARQADNEDDENLMKQEAYERVKELLDILDAD